MEVKRDLPIVQIPSQIKIFFVFSLFPSSRSKPQIHGHDNNWGLDAVQYSTSFSQTDAYTEWC